MQLPIFPVYQLQTVCLPTNSYAEAPNHDVMASGDFGRSVSLDEVMSLEIP